jgi:GrpB-like predicted nucleotidyltransferase (UPF0157 family)
MSNDSGVVVPYHPEWPIQFQTIKKALLSKLDNLIIGIEHVGSTAVPGLAAKPILDMDAIYQRSENLPMIINNLTQLGYEYQGNRGIEGREAFKAPNDGIKRNLYVCREGCLALRNHLLLRDHFLSNAEDREKYGHLKNELAPLYSASPELYLEGKTGLILDILKRYGLSEAELNEIKGVNTAKKT